MQFSHSLLTLCFVLRPMILLTIYTTIFHEMAGCTFLQFDVITSSGAAGSTAQHRVALTLALLYNSCAHPSNYLLNGRTPNNFVEILCVIHHVPHRTTHTFVDNFFNLPVHPHEYQHKYPLTNKHVIAHALHRDRSMAAQCKQSN